MTINRNMRFFASEVSVPDFANAWKQDEADVVEKSFLLLNFIGEEVIAFLRSYTGNKLPEHRSNIPSHPDQQPGMPRPEQYLGTRQTHPGGWADVSKDLMKKYKFRVDNDGSGWKLSILNTSDHAIYVEAMDGLFVVRGVLDPGGPVHRALAKAIKKITPGWQLQSYQGKAAVSEDFPNAITTTVGLGPVVEDM